MAWLMGGGIFAILISIVVGFLFLMAPLMIWHNTSATRAQTKKLNATMLRIEQLLIGKSQEPVAPKHLSKLIPSKKKPAVECPVCFGDITDLDFSADVVACPHCNQSLTCQN